MTEASPSEMTVRFGRRPTRGLLLGFSTPRCAALGAAAAVVVAAMLFAGLVGLGVSAVAWGPLAASAFVRARGRPAVEWAPVAGRFALRRLAGQHEYRARVTKPRPQGSLALPGDAAALRLWVDQPTGAAMVHDPHRQTLTAVARVSHPAFVLLSPADQAARVAGWGRVLAGLAHAGVCAAVQVTEATIPDPGTGLTAWWDAHGHQGEGWASAQYAELLDTARLGSSTHRSTVSLSLDMKAASRQIRASGRGVKGAAAVLRGEMVNLEHQLRAAELRLDGWLNRGDLGLLVRNTYDPAAGLTAGAAGADPAHAGPLAVSEHWDRLRHDTGWSSVLWVAEWPRIDVRPDFLHALIFTPSVRKVISLVARPVGIAEALRQIRIEKTGAVADAAQKAKIGQIADLSDRQEYEDVLSRERALIAGHAEVEFSGFVTVTAPTSSDLDAAVAAVSRAATQCACELRPLYGRQAQGFITAALPLARSAL